MVKGENYVKRKHIAPNWDWAWRTAASKGGWDVISLRVRKRGTSNNHGYIEVGVHEVKQQQFREDLLEDFREEVKRRLGVDDLPQHLVAKLWAKEGGRWKSWRANS